MISAHFDILIHHFTNKVQSTPVNLIGLVQEKNIIISGLPDYPVTIDDLYEIRVKVIHNATFRA